MEVADRNFVFIFGCQPQYGVAANSKMAKEIVARIRNSVNWKTLTAEIPRIFDTMTGVDVNYEIIQS